MGKCRWDDGGHGVAHAVRIVAMWQREREIVLRWDRLDVMAISEALVFWRKSLAPQVSCFENASFINMAPRASTDLHTSVRQHKR